jgi:hypothetical protein
VLGLFLWILFAIIVPNSSVYVAAELRPPESQENIDAQLVVLSEEFDIERRIRLDEQRTRDAPSNTAQSDAKDSFGRGYHRLLNEAYLESEQDRYRIQFPLEIRYAERSWEVQRRRFNSLYEQKRLADRLSKISPISLYDGVMSTLAGTDMAAFQRFSDAARAYRGEIVEYVRGKTENFSSSLFFTPCTKEEAEEYDRFIAQSREVKTPEEAAALMQRARPLFEKMYAETANLDLGDFPAFRMPSAFGDVSRAVPGLALLIFVNMLFFALSFVAFMRYDVR